MSPRKAYELINEHIDKYLQLKTIVTNKLNIAILKGKHYYKFTLNDHKTIYWSTKGGLFTMMYHVTPLKNLESIKKHGLLVKIGPRSKKIGEPVRAIYLFPELGYANDAVANWLGDEFDDDEDLIILPINVTEDDVERAPDIDYERASLADIPAKLIDFDHIIYCQ